MSWSAKSQIFPKVSNGNLDSISTFLTYKRTFYFQCTKFKKLPTLFPGINPLDGWSDSNNFSYFSLSVGLIVQSTADGGIEVIRGLFLGGGGFEGLGKGTSP